MPERITTQPPLTPALSQKEREFLPFSLREKGWG
jgi:hypothetical protein